MNSPDLGADPAPLAATPVLNPLQHGLALFQATPPDHAHAARWFRAAADAGDADGLAMLGLCQLEGLGLPADPVQARSLLELAAARGSAIGHFQLGRALLTARGGPGDEERGLWAYVAAAAQGHAEASFNLANCLHAGVGCLPDRLAAKALYLRSRALGCPLRPQGVLVQQRELKVVRALAQRFADPDQLLYLVRERQQELALLQAIAQPQPRNSRGTTETRLRPWRLAAGVVAAMAGTLGQYLRPGSGDAGPTTINF
ncbi:hypothetical protein [Roseateles sp.]|uniref:tetratricopeptide repeat protein n=1 Tax=Roseateles sp. TaxID=1971397 RepID=UPI0025DF5EB6|nr:hypothetical protein [Roseateles sp.]MBV8036922.1 sel1 repeat family protein [Roseateles sp.]